VFSVVVPLVPKRFGTSIFAEPLKDTPLIFLAVCKVVAVEALPLKDAVIVPAEKLPEASLATIVETVFALVALEVIVGFPADPSALVIEIPVPETAIDLEIIDPAEFLVNRPVVAINA
jgi:hypothetical protein